MMSCHWLIARGAMRCIACGAELRLMQSELDNAFLCDDCDRPSSVGPDSALLPTKPDPVRSARPASLRPDERVSDSTTRPTLVPSEDDLDECEILLRRAIEMVRGSTRWSQPTEALLTACQEGPSRVASYRFITIAATPPTSQRTRNRVYACCGTETARACARCVIGLDGRWLRPIPQRGRLNAADVVRMQHS
jgi:hypothetical protein